MLLRITSISNFWFSTLQVLYSRSTVPPAAGTAGKLFRPRRVLRPERWLGQRRVGLLVGDSRFVLIDLTLPSHLSSQAVRVITSL